MQRLQSFRTCSTLRTSPIQSIAELVEEETPEQQTVKMGLILKAYDDCRQDTLALQVMHLLEVIWESEGIDIPLCVYNVTPARTSDSNHAMGGIIECVQNSDSRDNLGKKGFVSLKMYYEVGEREEFSAVALRTRGQRGIRGGAAQLHSQLRGLHILGGERAAP